MTPTDGELQSTLCRGAQLLFSAHNALHFTDCGDIAKEHDMDRRKFLKCSTMGTGAFVVSGCNSGTLQVQQVGKPPLEASPFAPWDELESIKFQDPAALPAAAILASNPHNTQPWTMTFNERTFEIHADTERHLGAFDPFRREMWIGLGCAIANAEIIGATAGLRTGRPTISHLGRNGAGRVSVALEKTEAIQHPLAQFIRERRTNRAPFLERPVQPDTLKRVSELVGGIRGASYTTFDRESDQGQAFAQGTLEATRAITLDDHMSRDAHVWFRSNVREVAQHRDGVSIPTAGLAPAVSLLGQLLPVSDKQKSDEYWLASTKRQLAGTSGFGIISVKSLYDRNQQIAAGRLWQRLHLAFTAQGIAAQPMNQLPEIVDRDRKLGEARGWNEKLRAISGAIGNATLAFRFGYPTRKVPHSARRPVDWVLPGS